MSKLLYRGDPGADLHHYRLAFQGGNSPIWASSAMDCPKNNYHNLAGIVESFANDQQFWSVKFLEAWDLESLIAENSHTGLLWTDPQTDVYICGHRGHVGNLLWSHLLQRHHHFPQWGHLWRRWHGTRHHEKL